MLFDLKKFYDTADEPYHVDFHPDFTGLDFPGYDMAAPVQCSFEAAPTPAGMDLELKVCATVKAECARCLEYTEETFSFERSWKVREKDLDQDEYDFPRDKKGCLNLDELIFQELVLEVPPVLLCSQDCQGLCPICGKKKAAGCTCQPADDAAPADARLSILKQLLN